MNLLSRVTCNRTYVLQCNNPYEEESNYFTRSLKVYICKQDSPKQFSSCPWESGASSLGYEDTDHNYIISYLFHENSGMCCKGEVSAALRPKECVFKEVLPELAVKEGKELTGPTEGASKPPPRAGSAAGAKALRREVGKGPTHRSPEGEEPDLRASRGCGFSPRGKWEPLKGRVIHFHF